MGAERRVGDCLLIASAWILLAAFLRPLQNLPFVDDWSYAWSVEHLLKDGELSILDWSSNLNFVQVLWGALYCLPFGFAFTALRVSTAVLAVFGLCCFYLLLRELDLGRREALAGTATLGLNPVFFILSWTFMTDVPFVAVMIAATLAMTRALRGKASGWLTVAVIFACLGLGIRTVGLAMPFSIVAALIACGGIGERRRELLLATVLPTLALILVVGWGLGHTVKIVDLVMVKGSSANRLRVIGWAIPLLPRFALLEVGAVTGSLGMGLLPLTVGSMTAEVLRRAAVFSLILGLSFAAIYAVGLPLPIPLSAGSTWAITELGATARNVPDFEPPMPPTWLPWAVSLIAIASFSIFLARVTALRGLNDGETFIAWLAAAHVVLIAILWLTYDRYLLVLLPLAIALFLRATPILRTPAAATVLVVFGIVSTIGLRDHLSYNGALWRVVDVLRSRGARESEIDGGYMVNGWLQYAHPEHAPRDAEGAVFVPWINVTRTLRYRISNRPLEGWRVLSEQPYSRWLGPSGKLYALQNPDADPRQSAGPAS